MPDPRMADALCSQGAAAHQAGALAAAEAAYRQALSLAPSHADSLHLLGVLEHQTGRHEAAVAHLRQALKLAPRVTGFAVSLGNVLRDSGQPREAGIVLRKALRSEPLHPDLHLALGKTLRLLGKEDEAEAALRRAVRLRPAFPEALCDLGVLLTETGRPQEALETFDRAIALAPDNPALHTGRGRALFEMHRFEEGIAASDEALRLKPDYLTPLHNRAMAQFAAHRFDDAEASLKRLLTLDPENADARLELGYVYLVRGELLKGWPLMSWLASPRAKRGSAYVFPPANWHGERVEGQPLVIYAEQGMGDAIQFARYVPMCAALAPDLVLVVPSGLHRLLRSVEGAPRVPSELTLPDTYRHAPMMHLPHVFRTSLETIPATVPYLRTDPADVARWRARVADLPGRRVGVVWAGNPKYVNDRNRSIAPSLLAPLFDVPGVTFVSLQKGVKAPAPLVDWMDEVGDLADTGALIEALDLVIGVDTAVVHLAGALARPVWLLNRFDTDWRWLLDRDDSPWYPTLRQFRQRTAGDWPEVIERAREALMTGDYGTVS